MNKPCVKCDQPRMRTRSGKELTMCEFHQREYWREKQADRNQTQPVHDESEMRICIDCNQTKPLSQFAKNGKFYRPRCKPCWSAYVSGARQPKERTGPVPRAEKKPAAQKAKRRHGPAPIITPGSLPSDEVIHRAIRPTIVFIDRENGRFLLCEVVSEKRMVNEQTIPFVAQFYDRLGYRLIEAAEILPQVQAEAGD